jgi:DNA repair exonuclease SbcCD ATPase subunit
MKTLARERHRKIKRAGFIVVALSGIIGWLAIFMFMSLLVSAQTSTYSSMKEQLAQIAGQIKAVQVQQDELLRRNGELTDGINALKQKLQKGGNLLLELRLQNDLRASREIADQVQELDKKIHGLTKRSVDLKKQLVSLLSVEIDRLSREADATTDTKKRLQRLQRVLQLQKEKETYQAQITEESNELLLSLEVTIAEDDGPDDIRQKAAIIEDQGDIIRAKERKLDSQIQDIQKNISLQRNMLELLRDIGRGEEDELDLDRSLRIAERQEEVAEAAFKVMQARREMWKAREKALTEKAEQFYREASKLLQPAPKGDPGESK